MGDSLEIWTAFAKITGMLVFVIAVLMLVLHLVKRLSAIKSGKDSQDFIRVLSVHHLSPKAKVVLLDVMHEKILIGVTSAKITSLAIIQNNPDIDKSHLNADKSHLKREIENRPDKADFQNFLNDKLAGTFLKKTQKNRGRKGEEDGR